LLDVFRRDQGRAGPVQEEVAFVERSLDFVGALDNGDPRKPLLQDLVNAIVDARRPQPHFGIGEIFFE
jgi:hypothetical protein